MTKKSPGFNIFAPTYLVALLILCTVGLVIWQGYLGATIREIGIPKVFVIKLGSKDDTAVVHATQPSEITAQKPVSRPKAASKQRGAASAPYGYGYSSPIDADGQTSHID